MQLTTGAAGAAGYLCNASLVLTAPNAWESFQKKLLEISHCPHAALSISTHLHSCQRRCHAPPIQRAQRGQQRPRAFSAKLRCVKVLQRQQEGWAGRRAERWIAVTGSSPQGSWHVMPCNRCQPARQGMCLGGANSTGLLAIGIQ